MTLKITSGTIWLTIAWTILILLVLVLGRAAVHWSDNLYQKPNTEARP